MAAAKHGGYLLVGGGKPFPSVGEKQYHIGSLNGQFRLTAHLFCNNIFTLRLYTPCIDKGKGIIQPLCIGINTIPGHTGSILHNGQTAADQPVEKSALAHVGPAYNSD